MTDLPALPDNIGKRRILKDINGQVQHFTVVDEIKMQQSDHPEKAIYLQKIQYSVTGKIEIRLGYYIIGKQPRMLGKWVWGQYATIIPVADYVRMYAKAQAKGWFSDLEISYS